MKTNRLQLLISVVLITISNLYTPAQTIIQMEYDGGVYKIPCRINGAKMKFILDTGSTDVCLSIDMADYLYENDLISDDDFYDIGYSTIADGSITEHIKLMIKDIEIGGLHLKNVKGVIMDGQSIPLLLGQSALQKLGSYTINGDKLIINSHTAGEGKIREQLLTNARNSIDNSLYALAISYYLEAEKILELDYDDMAQLAWCYKRENKYNDCYNICKKWFSLYENLNNQSYNGSMYELFWRCNYYFGYNEQALIYKQKKMLVCNPGAEKTTLAWDHVHLGQIYLELKRYDEAISCLEKSISLVAEQKGLNTKNLVIKDDKLLGCIYWYLCECHRLKYEGRKSKNYLELSMKCGNENAIKVCRNKNTREAFFSRGTVPAF